MTFFSKDYFLKLLKELTIADEQIKSLGVYVISFKEEYDNILEAYSFLYKDSSIHHKLVLLYLANQILQSVKGNDDSISGLQNGFKKFIIENFSKSKREALPYSTICEKFNDLERVWKERGVVKLQ